MKRKVYIETGVSFYVIDADKDLHSFNDLHLILAPFTLPPAIPKINLLDIEGMDGSIDLTEANGEVKYYDRDLKFTFTVFGDDEMTFEERQTFISNALNGRRCKITLDKDSDYYFIGRCTVNDYLCDKMLRQVVITATVAPYKLLQQETVESFELTSVGETILLVNRRKSVVPVITCTGDARISFGGLVNYPLTAGEHKILDLQLKEGGNLVTVSGTGTITFRYQEGDL